MAMVARKSGLASTFSRVAAENLLEYLFSASPVGIAMRAIPNARFVGGYA